MFSIRPSVPRDRDALFRIWSDAVRATHDFLSEEDVAFYARLVRDDYLPQGSFTIAADGGNEPVAFMGISGGMSGRKIDALFVAPSWHGRGVGRALVDEALREGGTLSVDVNEQNRGALAFYRRVGFAVEGRSPVDDSGRPYPLLHLVFRSPRAG